MRHLHALAATALLAVLAPARAGDTAGVSEAAPASHLMQALTRLCGAAAVPSDAAVWRARIDTDANLDDFDWTYLRLPATPYQWADLVLRRRADGQLFTGRFGGPLGALQLYGPLSDARGCRAPASNPLPS